MTVPARRWATRADLLSQLSKAESYLLTSPLNELTVEAAAAEASLSLHHFIRLFHQVYNLKPSELIARRRIETAKTLLASDDLNILEVAFEVGFKNASAFSRYFRKCLGVSPSQFRAQPSI